MKKTLLAFLVAGTATLPILTQANTMGTGGWVAVLPDGTEITGLHDPADVATATEFYTSGGSGVLTINQDSNTVVNLYSSFAGRINVSGFSSDLTINSQNGYLFRANANNAPALNITASSGANITINDGYYYAINPGGAVPNNAIGGTFSGMSQLNLNSASFQGGVGNRWIGGNGISLSGIDKVVIKNYADPDLNAFYGGIGDDRNDASSRLYGGVGMVVSSSTIYATNLYARGGRGGSTTWGGTFLNTANTSRTKDGSGGNASDGSATIITDGGILLGGDGGTTTYNFEDGHPLYGGANVNVSQIGGNGLNGTYSNSRFNNFVLQGGDAGTLYGNSRNDLTITATMNGGNATDADISGSALNNSAALGGTGGLLSLSESANTANATANGGAGLINSGTAADLNNSEFFGGNGGELITRIATSGTLSATGNTAAQGAMNTDDSTFLGGQGGSIMEFTGGTVSADASGGHGTTLSGLSTITNGTFTGGNGGYIRIKSGTSLADGGSALHLDSGTVDIYDGSFRGGAGGNISGDTVQASGGHAIQAENGVLNIMGGLFKAGQNGLTAGSTNTTVRGNGIYAVNSDVTINGNDVQIHNGLIYNSTSGTHALNLLNGSLNGELLITGDGTTSLTVSNKFKANSHAIKQNGGTVQVELTSADNGRDLENVYINDGTMSFQNYSANLNSGFFLSGTNSALIFSQGAMLQQNARINAGANSITTTTGDLVLQDASSINLDYTTRFNTNGVSSLNGGTIAVGGNLVITNTTAKINIKGILAVADGEIQLTTGGLDFGTTNLKDRVNADFGWLVKTELVEDGGVKAINTYNSLKDSELGDINSNVLASVDANYQTNTMSEADFYAINAAGASSTRFDISQLAESPETSFMVSQQVNRQLAARGTEYRSMNGFASSKPSLSKQAQPTGVAGPDGSSEKTMQGWIRAYGAKGSADKSGNFAEYDSGTWGTVIGIDKSFGNILVGLAGGMSKTDIDGAYSADIDNYHGSIYSTYGGEQVFIDVALTYGQGDIDETSATGTSSYDSDFMSAYLGGGMRFEIKEKAALTPEASLLATVYQQDGFDRSGSWGFASAQDYESSSYLSSLGFSLSTIHQLDWKSLAFLPEVRLHWLHEWNADQDSFMYNVNGIGFLPFAVRSRDEDTARFGLGLDMWSWKNENIKLELDYDGLISDTYKENIVSGKVTVKF